MRTIESNPLMLHVKSINTKIQAIQTELNVYR